MRLVGVEARCIAMFGAFLGSGVVGRGQHGVDSGSIIGFERLGWRGRGAGFLVGVEMTESEEGF